MRLLGSARRMDPVVGLACLSALIAATTSCQVIFGLDEYSEREPGAAAACAGFPAQASAIAGETAICGVRRLDALNATDRTDISPGAICDGDACYVYYQRRAAVDELLCARCDRLEALDCDPPAVVASGVLNPYVRTGDTPEIWASVGNDIQFAPITGPCQVGAFQGVQALEGVLNTGTPETYPAISPGGTVLFFVRTEGGYSRIHVATRSRPGAPFDDDFRVKGLYDASQGGLPGFHDLRPHPAWSGERVEALYFSSSRDGVTKDVPDIDVFVARQPAGSTIDTAFTSVEPVRQLSTPIADFPPWPLSESLWLWGHSEQIDSDAPLYDIFVIDVGCARRFGPWTNAPFVNVNDIDRDERSPAIAEDGTLLFAKSVSTSGGLTIFRATPGDGVFGAPESVSANQLGKGANTTERDPFPLPDGRLLFTSDRGPGGVRKIWISGDPPQRATAAPDDIEEGGPFVDTEGVLWLSLDGAIARALPEGEAWGAPQEVPIGRQAGRRDRSPRLTADRRALLFSSTRDGGFVTLSATEPAQPAIWAATRPDPEGDGWTVFPLPELSAVSGAAEPWISPAGCDATVSLRALAPGFTWDLVTATGAAPDPR